MPVPTAKLYLVENSLRGRKARKRPAVTAAAHARAEVQRQREERLAAEKLALMQAGAVAQLARHTPDRDHPGRGWHPYGAYRPSRWVQGPSRARSA